MDQEFKWIPSYEGLYDINREGVVRSYRIYKKPIITDCPQFIMNQVYNRGYKQVGLTDINGIKIWKRVHRLVALTFIANPENKEDVNHINSIKDDNRVENLEWATTSENVQHMYDMGHVRKSIMGDNNHNKKIDSEMALKIFNSIGKHVDVAKQFRVPVSIVINVRTGKSWSHLTKALYVKSNKRCFSDKEVLDIFNSSLPQKELAKQFNTSQGCISNIKRGWEKSSITGKVFIPNRTKQKAQPEPH